MDKRFTVIDNEYVNTGGHCMVDVTTVYDNQQKKLLYMLVGMDWMTLSTYDYVQNETPDGTEAEDFILYSMEMSDFSTDPAYDNRSMVDMPNEYFDLFNHGMLSLIKNKFKYDRRLTKTTVDNLPVELGRMVDVDYVAWLNDREMLITTDGEKILYDNDWLHEDSKNYVAARELQKMLEGWLPADFNKVTDKQLEEFYDERITIVVKDRAFTFANGADIYNGLCLLVNNVIDEQ